MFVDLVSRMSRTFDYKPPYCSFEAGWVTPVHTSYAVLSLRYEEWGERAASGIPAYSGADSNAKAACLRLWIAGHARCCKVEITNPTCETFDCHSKIKQNRPS